MDVEAALISKIIDTGRVEEVVSLGVTPDMFANEQSQAAWEFIHRFHRRYKEAPAKSVVQDEVPGFDFEHVQHPLDYMIDKFKGRLEKRAGQEMLLELADVLNNPEAQGAITDAFLAAARDLATLLPTNDIAKFSDSLERKEQYEKEVASGVRKGIPFGYKTLDGMTGGIKPHQFAVVSAFLGIGKSTAINSFAYNMWGLPEDLVIMVVTLELEKHTLMNKFDAMAAGINYRDIEHLNLSEADVERWNETAKTLRKKKKSKNDIIVLDRMNNATPDKVFAETVKHKPDVVFVDYLGLMRSSSATRSNSMWQSMVEITQDLKQNARTLGVPIIAAAQTNRSGSKDGSELDNIGASISIAQDADIVIGLHADEDMKKQSKMELRLQKNRMGPLGKIDCVWDHENNFFGEADGANDAVSRATKSMFPARKKSVSTDEDEDGAPKREIKIARKRPNPKPSPKAIAASNKEVHERLKGEEKARAEKKTRPSRPKPKRPS
jgi:replicative DNA helicase